MKSTSVADRVAHYDPGPTAQPDRESPTPEMGSVKDKIGRFGINSLAERPKNELYKASIDNTPPTVREMQHSVHRSATELPGPIHRDDIGMKQPLPNHTKEVVGSPISRPMPNTATHGPSNTSQNDKQLPPRKPKPPIPRKPIVLANAKPSGPAESPFMGQSQNQEETQKPPSVKNDIMGTNVRSRSPRPYGSNKQFPSSHLLGELDQSSPRAEEFRPKLPPRTGTSSTNQSPSPQASVSSLSNEYKPTLPPRRGISTLPRKPTRNQGIVLEDNESSSLSSTSGRSLNESYPSLLDGPNAMDKNGRSKTASSSSLALNQTQPAKKAPPPPPRQRRTGLQATIQSAEMSRGGTSRPSPPPGNMQRPPQRSATLNDRNQSPKPIHTIPRKLPRGDATESTPKITLKEQKRYENVWAVNKGLLIPGPNEPFCHVYPPDASEMVLNLVVRDIWSRSRLPNDVLLQVWDLVDRQNIRLLTREEFIVGMWLIDQILMGNRLPRKVPPSVWDSLRNSSDASLI